ncbi:ATP synthase F0 subunit B [[Mycoplasma] falconis]|uniref:ATP synthase subunit b n=1 Tax=[Mycoplasma] falconis TaxID=92403 RepID=A0A501XC13_9BACT|nr:ATP synthase F0 subunit B [[Mycoplasma] falconis]TPE58100.1 ATP synthase F0 subunit B [[Mycoplasma] falconis]
MVHVLLDGAANATSNSGGATAKISEELEKAFAGLTFNWPFFVFSLITLGIITLMITLLVYRPIKKMVKARQNLIQDNIDASIKAKEDALLVRENNDKKILEATNQANTIINNAKSESEKIINSGTGQAKKRAELIMSQAETLLQKKQSEFEKNQKKIIMESAVELAKKIIGREIKDIDNIKMINEVLGNK